MYHVPRSESNPNLWGLNVNDYNIDDKEIQGLTVLAENREWRFYNVDAHVDPFLKSASPCHLASD